MRSKILLNAFEGVQIFWMAGNKNIIHLNLNSRISFTFWISNCVCVCVWTKSQRKNHPKGPVDGRERLVHISFSSFHNGDSRFAKCCQTESNGQKSWVLSLLERRRNGVSCCFPSPDWTSCLEELMLEACLEQ